jgi:hypothetical protein
VTVKMTPLVNLCGESTNSFTCCFVDIDQSGISFVRLFLVEALHLLPLFLLTGAIIHFLLQPFYISQ